MTQFDSHLLIVDDDERIRGLLKKFLMRAGFLVTAARDAAHARRVLSGLDFDLIVLDVMMPGEDGLSLTRSLREDMQTPILLLTAKGETGNRIEGLEAGADDYLAKPFEPKELLLRINAILRRMPDTRVADTAPKVLSMGPIRYDIERGELWQGDDLVRLAWHIGNRHCPCQLEPARRLSQNDHVIRDMLTKPGATWRDVPEPFIPEGGAYGHGRTHSHAH